VTAVCARFSEVFVSQHRAPRRRADKHHRPPGATRSSSAAASGRHRAAGTPEPPAAFTPRRRGIGRPSGFLVTGASALIVAAAGAMSVGSAQAVHAPVQRQSMQALSIGVATDAVDGGSPEPQAAPDALGSHLDRNGRPATISRNAERVALDDAQQDRLEAAAERQATARTRALAELANLAEDRAREIEASMWVLPVNGYDITATFGDGGGLWSSDHTGLDFAAGTGAPVMSVAQGVVTDVSYAGAYGNRVIVTHEDGTETWYCHLNDYTVSSGQSVGPGTTIGHIGMTGNTTGPHLHFEVRPSPDLPIDPYGALVSHGVHP
jgi:murein DD-endopeptidase MepM/ murein hydrolase activator NlpD